MVTNKLWFLHFIVGLVVVVLVVELMFMDMFIAIVSSDDKFVVFHVVLQCIFNEFIFVCKFFIVTIVPFIHFALVLRLFCFVLFSTENPKRTHLQTTTLCDTSSSGLFLLFYDDNWQEMMYLELSVEGVDRLGGAIAEVVASRLVGATGSQETILDVLVAELIGGRDVDVDGGALEAVENLLALRTGVSLLQNRNLVTNERECNELGSSAGGVLYRQKKVMWIRVLFVCLFFSNFLPFLSYLTVIDGGNLEATEENTIGGEMGAELSQTTSASYERLDFLVLDVPEDPVVLALGEVVPALVTFGGKLERHFVRRRCYREFEKSIYNREKQVRIRSGCVSSFFFFGPFEETVTLIKQANEIEYIRKHSQR
jgi:hypothetical protein